MFGWIEIFLVAAAVVLFALRLMPRLRAYRCLLDGGCVQLLVTTLFPRTGNPVGEFLFDTSGGGPFLPRELFAVLWWVVGAWLVKSLLNLVPGRQSWMSGSITCAIHLNPRKAQLRRGRMSCPWSLRARTQRIFPLHRLEATR